MGVSRTVLTDTESGEWLAAWRLDATSGLRLSGSSAWSVTKETMRGGLSDGVDAVRLDNGALSMTVLPTRGMGLWKGSFRGIPIEWRSPVLRPVNPMFVNLQDRRGLGWLNGFNELMCRCGLSSHGPPGVDRVVDDQGNASDTELTLHGRVANLPAHHVAVEVNDAGPGTLSVTGIVDEATMFGPALRLTSTVSTMAGSSSLTIQDRITNLGAQPTELELLYHTNIGRPFLEAGSRLVAAVVEMAPRDPHSAASETSFDEYAGPVTGFREEAFFFELAGDSAGQTTVMLRNAAGDRGLSLSFFTSELPAFTLWKNTQAEADGYVTGLEPGTSFPNLRTFERERGRVIRLDAGATHCATMTLEVHDSAAAVAEMEAKIRALQTNAPCLHDRPIGRFTP